MNALILNCGFPKAEQFAEEAHLKYLGGISVGMGGMAKNLKN